MSNKLKIQKIIRHRSKSNSNIVLYVCFVDRCLSLFVVLSDPLRFTDSDCPFGISKLFENDKNNRNNECTNTSHLPTIFVFAVLLIPETRRAH